MFGIACLSVLARRLWSRNILSLNTPETGEVLVIRLADLFGYVVMVDYRLQYFSLVLQLASMLTWPQLGHVDYILLRRHRISISFEPMSKSLHPMTSFGVDVAFVVCV